MGLISKSRSFLKLPLGVKLLFAEALFTSARVKCTLKFFAFVKVMNWLGATNSETPFEANRQTIEKRQRVKTALVLCNKYAPWPTECYTLSLTGKLLLKRRGIESTLYIGIRKSETGQYQGHAWLRANETYITGYVDPGQYTLHAMFS